MSDFSRTLRCLWRQDDLGLQRLAFARLGAVAQLGERLAGSQKVRGSSPLGSIHRTRAEERRPLMGVEVATGRRASAPIRSSSRGAKTDRSPWRKPDATNRWNAGASAGGTSGSARRRKTSTPAATEGGGTKAPRGRRLEMLASYQALHSTPLTLLGQGTPSLCATAHSTIRSARASGVRGSSSR